jgi:hypothetical protein
MNIPINKFVMPINRRRAGLLFTYISNKFVAALRDYGG